MAVLTTAQRKKLPSKVFAGPGRSYPINDPAHAINAKARATQQEEKGHLSPDARAHIDKVANAMLARRGR